MIRLAYPFSLLMIVAAMAGCGDNDASPVTPDQGPHTQNTTYQGDNAGVSPLSANSRGNYTNTGALGTDYVRDNSIGNNGTQTNGYNRALADRLAVAADAVPGVDSATAIVYGNDAVIGVNTRFTTFNNTNQRNVVEQQVRSAVRAIAPQYNIRVTSDRNMMARIRSLDNTFRANTATSNNNRPQMYGNGSGSGYFGENGGIQGDNGNGFTGGGPNTVAGNVGNVGNDFAALVRDLGRTVTAPFR